MGNLCKLCGVVYPEGTHYLPTSTSLKCIPLPSSSGAVAGQESTETAFVSHVPAIDEQLTGGHDIGAVPHESSGHNDRPVFKNGKN